MLIENLLSELVIRVTKHFNLNPYDSLAIVARSRVAKNLTEDGNPHNLTLDELSEKLFYEISHAEV